MSTKSVDSLLADIRILSEERYETVQAVRAEIQNLISPLSEEVKYGGFLFSSGAPFCGVFAYKSHVSVEFSHGAAIADRLGHLEGDGKLRRHIKLASPEDARTKHLSQYISLAVESAKRAA